MKLIIGGDLAPTKSNEKYFIDGDAEFLIGKDLLEILKKSDLNIFNLEVPLIESSFPIKKCGPLLIATPKTINGMKMMNINFLGLANNHILDQGEKGLHSTIEILKKNNIFFSGAGANANESSSAFIQEINNVKIAVFCCADHEFSIATESTAGANVFDPCDTFDQLEELKKQCDYLIVLYHGGKEHYRYPSPNLQKICRKMVDKGANIVACQHSHCIGCKEKWGNGEIIYGQGNFLFDYSTSDFWKTSLLLQLDVTPNGSNIDFIPLVKKGNTVRIADENMSKDILDSFYARSEEIIKRDMIEKKYEEYAINNLDGYLYQIAGIKHKKFYRLLKKIFGNKIYKNYYVRYFDEETSLALKNIVECDAHRELLLEGLKKYLE